MKSGQRKLSSLPKIANGLRTLWPEVLGIALVLLVFCSLRLYQIEQSLFFFGDMGRDYYTLQTWQETGKPPLLGPQTSALPFNQGAVYFYLLYPFFLLTGQSLYSTFMANLVIHLVVFSAGLALLWPKSDLRRAWIGAWFLLSLQPQAVLQHREIWNPSLVSVSLLSSFMCWQLFIRDRKRWQLAGWGLGLALACAFSYSVVPVALAFLLLIGGRYRTHLLPSVVALGVSAGLVNLPVIAFEVRHRLVLTKLLIFGEKLPQTAASWSQKLSDGAQFVVASPSMLVAGLVLLTLCVVVAWQLRQVWLAKNPATQPSDRDRVWLDSWWLLLTTFLIMMVLPVAFYAHYIFGLVTLGILVIVTLPPRSAVAISLLLAASWLTPGQLQQYFQPIFRTPADTEACTQQVCAQLTEPVFVSVQPGYEPHHNHAGLEFRFLLKKAGCEVYDVETQPEQAEQMVVFADNSTYTHGQTDYNELTQFGQAEEIGIIQCQAPVTAHLLRRVSR